MAVKPQALESLPAAIIPIWRSIKRMRRSAFAIFRRSRANYLQPTWSGLESEHVSYNAGYTNVHELIPWRTLSGRQQLYQDHPWMQPSAKVVAYRPPIDTRSVSQDEGRRQTVSGKALNF
ncbi:Respiratory nitrate reductase 2 alpha chain [Klebsiella pneumoniae]|nr:Respiratory nitrate reductase 2 alpha chain [Klebsiella pneumoniae]